MATNNSTASYSDFVCDFSYKLFQVKALIAGANSILNDHPIKEMIDVTYLLDDANERLVKLAADISNTEYLYQKKQSDICQTFPN